MPSTFAGMSIRGGPGAFPTSVYAVAGFVPGQPGARPVGSVEARRHRDVEQLAADQVAVGDGLAAADTTPLLTVRLPTGTPRRVEAIPSSAWYAAAAAHGLLASDLKRLAAVRAALVRVTSVSAESICICGKSMFSSSAATISSPSVSPVRARPCRASPGVLSAWIVIHESIYWGSRGPWLSKAGLAAAFAEPFATPPSVENPTISVPPAFRALAREIPSRNQACHQSTCLCHDCRGLLDRGQNFGNVPQRQRCPFIAVRSGRRQVLRRREQVGGLDHHAVLAVAAMRHLTSIHAC